MGRFSLLPPLAFAVFAAACTSELPSLQDEYDLMLEESAGSNLEVVDHYPIDGGLGLGHEVEPYFLFNRPLNRHERGGPGDLTVVDLDGLGEGVSDFVLDFDGAGVRYAPSLRRDRDYYMSFRHSGGPDESVEAWFGTDEPLGDAFDMSHDLDVINLGGGHGDAGALEDAFDQPVRPAWVLQAVPKDDSEDGRPTVDLFFAPGRFDASQEQAYYLRRDFGYIGAFTDVVLEEDGWFQGTRSGVFLPIWAGNQVAVLYLEDAVMTGWYTWSDGRLVIEQVGLAGVIGTRWLLRTAELGGLWRTIIDSIEPDVDSNDNGVPDSACIMIRSEPIPIELGDINL